MQRILVIEDEELLRNLYSELLEMKGFHVETAKDGKVALEHLNEARKPDLILLDLNMPEMDGVEFLKIIKSIDKLKRVPVILITGVIQVEKISAGLDLGAVGYIEKANSPVEVISKLDMILGAIISTDVKNEITAGPKKMNDLELQSM
jgi:CheY-like chemotaxis protein